MRPALFGIGAMLVLAVIVAVNHGTLSDSPTNRPVTRFEDRLPELPPNKWVKIGTLSTSTWHRQRHAGAAYDTYRKKYFVFGSDTHGENWDNAVHEFDPLILRWSEHYQRDRRRTYQVDAQGHPVAGGKAARPWAMHVHDSLLYDPTLDALVLMAAPVHNPAIRAVRGIKSHPIWIYKLRTREWRPLDGPDGASPFGFAGASAYDSDRDVIMTYSRKGIWELGPEREHWLQASPDSHHEMYQSMVYDAVRHNLLVFGGQEEDCSVWVYTPAPGTGDEGTWEERKHDGDTCIPDAHVPVAFDSHNGVALLVVDNPSPAGGKGATTSSTLVYDPEADTYRKLDKADLPAVGMNYTLAYDPNNRVFYMLQGGREDPPAVWALHLELLTFEE